MRPRVITVLAIVLIALGGFLTVPAAYGRLTDDLESGAAGTAGGSDATAKNGSSPTLTARPVNIQVDGFFSWALLDRNTGAIAGSPNISATSTVESMIKAWIVADFLRTSAEQGRAPTPAELTMGSKAIRDSDDTSGEKLYAAAGKDQSTVRMIQLCKLTDTRLYAKETGWWGLTQISARDAVRMGDCIKNGTAAGPKWTTWVLDEMTKVRGSAAPTDQHDSWGGGRWGIVDGLPDTILKQEPVAMKNGWTVINTEKQWHVNCLAVSDDWALSVLLRYDEQHGLKYGATVCADVASQLAKPAARVAPRA
jgi:hypothetical protein